MKKHFIITALIASFILPAILSAQSQAIEKLCEKYDKIEGFTVVSLNKAIFDMFAKRDSLSETDIIRKYQKDIIRKYRKKDKFEQMCDMAKGMESLKVISCEGEKVPKQQCDEFYNDVLNAIPINEYKELLSVKEKGTKIKMLLKSEPNGNGEFIILVREEDQTTLVVINGKSDMLSMDNIQNLMKMKGMGVKDDSDEKKESGKEKSTKSKGKGE
ncbi:MAG: DUF4252 domain-containing protein [Bacteroidota bacterium]